MALRELLAKFDVDTAQAVTKLQQLGSAVDKMAGTLGALTDAFIGSALVHGVREFIEGQIEAGSRVNDLSERLGLGVEELQKFQFAAGLAGVGGEEAAKALQFLNKNIGESIDGNKEATETFQKLGIQLKDADGVRELSDIIPEVADAFEELGSDQERTAFAMKVFGKSGAALLPLMKEGGKGLKALSDEFERLGGGMTEGFTKAADEAGDEVDKLKFAFNGWKSQLAMAILPLVTRGAKYLQGWVGTLRTITRESRLAELVWIALGAAGAAAGFKAAAGFAKMLGVIPKEAGFWKTVLGLGEIGLVIAAVVLLALAFEDFYTFLQGGDSIIGDVIEGLFGIGAKEEVIQAVNAALDEVGQTLEGLYPIAVELGRTLGVIWDAAKPFVIDFARITLKFVADAFIGIAKAIQFMVGQAGAVLTMFGGITQKIGQLTDNDKLLSFSTALAATGANFTNASNPQTVAVSPDTWNGGARPATRGEMNQQNDITINIDGSKDPAATGQAVKGAVREAIDWDATAAALNTGG